MPCKTCLPDAHLAMFDPSQLKRSNAQTLHVQADGGTGNGTRTDTGLGTGGSGNGGGSSDCQ